MTFGPSFHRSFRRFLCIATANQRQRQSVCIATARAGQTMCRYGEAMAATEHMHRDSRWREPADYASLRRTNGSDRAWREQGRLCITTAKRCQRQFMHREQGRLCIATAAQRQRPSMPRDGESRADYASLRGSNGSDISCIATARAALVSHG